jgi:hypothetical protein
MKPSTTIAVTGAAAACLTAMVIITLATGISQETFEIVRSPDLYAQGLAEHAGALRALFGIDSAFLVLYAAVFVGFATAVAAPSQRIVAAIGVSAILLTALLDMVEDHHILAMLYGVEAGSPPSAGEIALQHTLSQVKFNVSYLGTFFVGLCVPPIGLAGRALGVLLTAGTLLQSVWLYAAPIAALPAGNFGRWIGFLVGFALVILVLRGRAAGAAATGAPA